MKNRFLIASAALLIFAVGCKDDKIGNPGEMLANTDKVYSDQYHSAVVTASVYGDGISERGVCWGPASSPTIEDFSANDGQSGAGTFTLELTGLTAGSTYYARTYAMKSDGTVTYGSNRSFTTVAYLNTIITGTTADLTTIQVKAKVSDGLANLVVTERGVYYGTTNTPEVGGTKIAASTAGKGDFTVDITGLAMETTYYVKSYAISSEGTIYSAVKEVKTLEPTPALFLNALNASNLKYGIVRDATTTFVMHYSFNINATDETKCFVTVTYIEPTGNLDAKHVTLPVTFNTDFTQATWTTVSNNGNDFSGMNRNGSALSVIGTSGLTLDTPIPSDQILALFVSKDYGGIGRISELQQTPRHGSIPASMFSGAGALEVKAEENGILVYPNSQPGYCVMVNSFANGVPNMPQNEDTIKFSFGSYNTAWNSDPAVHQAGWDLMEPFRNIWYDTDGLIIIREVKEVNPIFGEDESAGAFYYYAISVKNEKWARLWLRQWGK